MPYINIKITREGVTAEQKAELIKGATELLARVLNKNPKTTIVTIEEVDMDSWGIGGDPVEIAREKGEAQDAKIARLEADKEEQEKELENLKKLLLQDGKKEDIPPLPEEETTEETPVFTLNNNALKLKKEKKTKPLTYQKNAQKAQLLTLESQKETFFKQLNALTQKETDKNKAVSDATNKLTNAKATLSEKENALASVQANLANYAINSVDTSFLSEEDQALFNKVKDNNDEGTTHMPTHARQVRNFLKAKFNIAEVGGYRAGDDDGTGHGHGSGLSADFMVDKATGDKLSAYVAKNMKALGVYYQIWEQRYYMAQNNIYGPANTWNLMPDRGGATANHYDHVHISFNN